MVKYNKELLDECLVRDSASLIGEYEKLNRDAKIKYKCNCGNEDEKTFRRVYLNGGLYCEDCSNKNKINKTKKTNLEKYGTICSLNNEQIIEKIKKTNIINLGVEWPSQSKEVKDKIKLTNLNNLGVEWPSQSKEVKDKIKLTNLNNLGVEWPSQSKEVKDKIKLTNIKIYGVECPLQSQEIKDKIKVSNIKKYSVENPSQNEDIKNKKIQTSLKNYGVKSPMQHPYILEKSALNSYKLKDYILPSKNILKYQGYENFALDKIIKDWKIKEIDIITSRDKVPEIWWIDKDEKRRRYFVDIYIPSKNLIIEVKSIWTITLNKDDIMSKINASKDLGFNALLWVFDKKGNLCEEYN